MSSHHSNEENVVEEDFNNDPTYDATENVVTQAANLNDSVSQDRISEEEEEDVEPKEAAATDGTVAAQHTREELHIGDYIAYERITPLKEWSHTLGKVIGFPSAHTVKVARFDAAGPTSQVQDPQSEEELKKTAEKEDKLQLWHDREDLRKQLRSISDEEKVATEKLLNARDATLMKQQQGSERTAQALKSLDSARTRMQNIPARQWRDLRSNGEPAPVIANLIRAVMLILHEDRAKSWDLVQSVLREPNFMDRLLDWDCTVTPMSVSRRRKVVQLCAEQDVPKVGDRKKKRATSPYSEGGFEVAPAGEGTGGFAVLDAACRGWINAQLAASDAGDAQARLMEECFAEQQDQRFLLREVNDIRVNVSKVETQMLEAKLAILGIDPDSQAVLPISAYKAEGVYFKAVYRDDDQGRFVQDIILKQSVLTNFGPSADESVSGYVHLSEEQKGSLEAAVHESYSRHDIDEMENLALRRELEEQEIKELQERIDELRSRDQLTPEEEEELEELTRILADAERRHASTVSRIADLHAVGRGAKEITVACKKPEFKYTRLHAKMAGDWSEILNDPERYDGMVAALQDDLAQMLNIPPENIFDVEARAGSLLIDFTVKHSGELDDEELQQLVNNGDFSSLGGFYEKVTFKKTGPLNTSEQEESFALATKTPEPEPVEEVNFSGFGVKQSLSDYYNSDGELEEDFSEEILNDVDYRKAKITIPPVREDYDIIAIHGPGEIYTDGANEEKQQGTQMESHLGLTETRDVEDGEDTYPGTTLQERKLGTVAMVPAEDSQASSSVSNDLEKPSAASSSVAVQSQSEHQEEAEASEHQEETAERTEEKESEHQEETPERTEEKASSAKSSSVQEPQGSETKEEVLELSEEAESSAAPEANEQAPKPEVNATGDTTEVVVITDNKTSTDSGSAPASEDNFKEL